MKVTEKKDDVEKIEKYLLDLGFVCSSYPSSQQQIYSKNKEVVIIKTNRI